MAIFSKFLSSASTSGFRFVRNSKVTKWTAPRVLVNSSKNIHPQMKMNLTQFSRLLSTVAASSSIPDLFPLGNFMGKKINFSIQEGKINIPILVNHSTMPVVDIMEPKDLDKLMEYSTISPYPVSIEELLENGNKDNYSEEQSYRFLKKEVAVRLAHMIMELQHLPKELHAEDKCRFTIEKYCTSFNEAIQFENRDATPETLQDFMKLLIRNKERHQVNDLQAIN